MVEWLSSWSTACASGRVRSCPSTGLTRSTELSILLRMSFIVGVMSLIGYLRYDKLPYPRYVSSSAHPLFNPALFSSSRLKPLCLSRDQSSVLPPRRCFPDRSCPCFFPPAL